jgi:type I restriction enzyme, R subunit
MTAIDKRDLTEQEIRTQYITPAIRDAGWDIKTQVREEFYFTAGRVNVRGKLVVRGVGKRADYILYYKPNIPIAIIEAKDNTYSVGGGMQQALAYADTIDVPFVYSSNGDAFLEHDKTLATGQIERELPLDQFPSPDQLWQRYCAWKGLGDAAQSIVEQDYHSDGTDKAPRYYQLIAINRTLEAIAQGQNRILLVMATGTGKTYTAFQIIWRLWKSKTKKRILFLADRNILVDQTKTNDFKPFGSAMTKITKRQIDKAFEVYLSLYQAVSGNEEERNIYKQFSPDFFDLVVVDECHRGSAAEDSAWREILDYFTAATQIGLTATPKETEEVSNIDYFGAPLYIYSLKDGIEDGFLAPYKVIRVDLDKDLDGWRPEPGQVDKSGQVIEDRIYNQKDFDRTLVLEQRTKLVAKRISEFLKATDRYAKTIVFCEDIDHAERMRQALVNENTDLVAENRKYIMRITGDEKEGKLELDNFIDPESRYPVIATTSKLMTTGVDAKTCKLIVLDQRIESMTEFKQIIGRGTRIDESRGKMYFTVLDFKKATKLFRDDKFDGPPVQVYEPKGNEPIVPPDVEEEGAPEGSEDMTDLPERVGRIKYVVDDVKVAIAQERVEYYAPGGRLITESMKDYTRKTAQQEFASLDTFLQRWSDADQKRAIIQELQDRGIFWAALAEEVGQEFDPFDLLCHVAFDQPPQSRRDRAENVRKRDYFSQYGEQARAVLAALLDKYADGGIETIEDFDILKVQPLNELGTPIEIIKLFGTTQKYREAVRGLAAELYRTA